MNNSKIVTSDQLVPHEDLIKIISKYHLENYQRPVADFTHKLMEKILPILDKYQNIILDTGCGTGESSFNLAKENPEYFVLGIDKSHNRIERNNFFKLDESVDNYQIVRGELLDIWPLLYKYSQNASWKIVKQCLYYPNPWPKKKAIKRRWQANPVIPFICGLQSQIEVRTNWFIYALEIKTSLEYFTKMKFRIDEFIPSNFMTNFEKKYHLSGQKLYSVELDY